MIWVEVFAVFLVSHLVGDFVLQTEWQAQHKAGGLGPAREPRRALLTHVSVYMLCFVPAFAWLWDDAGWLVLVVAALLFATHAVQDDGRLLEAYARRVKRMEADSHPLVVIAVDQSLHVVVLFGLALLALA